ncbi:AAA family ATPase [Candidatus Woesearchaeota archaeon]|nr:AAA family ATPase [Candidatus Woesearchaeota archaeon]
MIKLSFSDIARKRVFKDRDELFSLIPKKGIIGRIEEKNNLVMELSPLLLNSSTRGIFVQGSPGTGKTSCILELLDELGTELKRQKLNFSKVYINCSENRKESTILLECLKQLNPSKKYPKTWVKSKAIDEFYAYVKSHKDTLITIILDEVDFVLKTEGDDILYRLSRINSYLKSKINVLYISNDENISKYIKRKTISSLGRVKISFLPYDEEELKDILKSRIKFAFNKNIVTVSAVNKISEIEANKSGDARKALTVLDHCGKILMTSKSNKIDLNVVEEAYRLIEMEDQEDLIDQMNLHDKVTYFTILRKNKKEYDLESLFNFYKDSCSFYDIMPKTKRSLSLILKKLEKDDFIDYNARSKVVKISIDNILRKKMIKRIRDLI